MDLFAAPSDQELQKRKNSRQKDCKHTWTEGAIAWMELTVDDKNVVTTTQTTITEEFDLCSHCGLKRNIREVRDGSIRRTK